MILYSQPLLEFVSICENSRLVHSLRPSPLLYNCPARSTNRPFLRKTNPNLKTRKTAQPHLPQRFTPILRAAPHKKTNPNKPNSALTQTANLAQISHALCPRRNTTSDIRRAKYKIRFTPPPRGDTTYALSGEPNCLLTPRTVERRILIDYRRRTQRTTLAPAGKAISNV